MKTIYDQQLIAGRVLAKMPQWKAKEQKALADLRQFIGMCQRPYVSLSWGKQSIILAHMAYRIDKAVYVIFINEPDTDILADFAEVRQQFLQKWPVNYAEYFMRDGQLKDFAAQFEAKQGFDGVVMGLAAVESKGRRYTLAKADYHNIYRYSNGKKRCCPLRHWSNQDVAAYVSKYEIPMLSTYRRYGFDARTSAKISTQGKHTAEGFLLLPGSVQKELLERAKTRRDI
jgi:3'-phosphoadenosine 5'-phosphosulfate sulfotransferase (PAPS reductase)/FAD synthetase